MYALNATDGTKIWNYTTGHWVGSSAAVVGDVVVFGSHDHKVYALNTTNGNEVWNYTTGDRVFSSPAAADGVVYIGSLDNNVYALDVTDGTKIWNYTTGNQIHSSPAVTNDVVYVGSIDGKVYALNVTDGSLVWSYQTGNIVGASPAVAEGNVYIGSDDGNLYAFGTPEQFTVTFTASGLPSSTEWSVTFNGTIQSSTSNTIGFTAPNGNYSYSVSTPSGYTSSSQLNGIATVDDANVTINIVYIPSTPPPPPPPIYYDLTILVVGNGTVSPTNTTYTLGTVVNLKAISDAGWTFSGWSGGATGTTNTTIIMNSDKIVTATFTQNEYTLTILVIGEGTVSPNNGTHLSGTTVNLEAIAAEGWNFNEWSGNATGTTNTTITMDGDKTVTATFTNTSIPEFPAQILLLIILVAVSATAILLGNKQLNVSSVNMQRNDKHI
jgi:hypothetical protein